LDCFIATDQLGDPIIVDTGLLNSPVFSAVHGEGNWEPFVIADSLDNFKEIILALERISSNRRTPSEIEKNPINALEAQGILTKIEALNPNADIWYWESFFDTD
jgi:hypothetical protein